MDAPALTRAAEAAPSKTIPHRSCRFLIASHRAYKGRSDPNIILVADPQCEQDIADSQQRRRQWTARYRPESFRTNWALNATSVIPINPSWPVKTRGKDSDTLQHGDCKQFCTLGAELV